MKAQDDVKASIENLKKENCEFIVPHWLSPHIKLRSMGGQETVSFKKLLTQTERTWLIVFGDDNQLSS